MKLLLWKDYLLAIICTNSADICRLWRSQCGFAHLASSCFILAGRNSPTEPEIKALIEGNLCRCTGYQQIVESISKASEILVSGRGLATLLHRRAILIPDSQE